MRAHYWIEVARELLALKASGAIANVWIDAGVVRVSYHYDPTERHYIPDARIFIERVQKMRRIA